MIVPVFKTPRLFVFINWLYSILVSIFDLKPRKWGGFATPIGVFVVKRDKKLEKHEMEHVRQWWRYLVLGFLPYYLYLLVRFGYDNHPLEIEAKLAEYKDD